jgi:hypothetical protein
VRGGISARGLTGALSAALVGVLAFGAGAAWAGGGPTVFAIDDQYSTSLYDTIEGQQADFVNTGPSNTHTVTADAEGPDGQALFRTGNVPPGGGGVAVRGTEYLAAGFYDFHCSIHSEMQSTLEVADSASGPDPRPAIDVKVKSKKLEKVVKSGKLKVEVTAAGPTDADRVSLSAKKGRKGITKKAILDVNAGDSTTAKLNLKKKAAEKLADLEKAKIKVQATVDFGSLAKTSKKLK